MATTCELSGQGNGYGNKVSHSKQRTHRVLRSNIQKKTIVLDGQKATLHISTRTLRTLKKQGIIK